MIQSQLLDNVYNRKSQQLANGLAALRWPSLHAAVNA